MTTNRQLRKDLRKKGIPVHRTIIGARMMCRWLYFKHGVPHWVFYENYGFVILNLTTAQGINHARKKHKIRRMRVRDMDRMCVFRHPRVGWMYKKKEKTQ